MPTHRTLKVVPTPPLAAFTGLIVSFILGTPLPHFCSASGASDTTLDCGTWDSSAQTPACCS